MNIDYDKLYSQLNNIYSTYPNITKLTSFNFKIFPENILKVSPLIKLNKLVNKYMKSTNKESIIKLNEDIIKTNQWLVFTYNNYQKTINNENFKKICIEQKKDPVVVNDYLKNQNILISNTQLKKQNFIYHKLNKVLTKNGNNLSISMDINS